MEKSFRSAILITWAVAGACALAFAAMFFMPRIGIDWRENYFYLFFSIPICLFCLILLPLLYYFRKKYLTGAKELLEGKHLVHWQYHRDEWNLFAENEWKQTQKKALWTPFGIVAGVVILGYLFKGWTVDDFKVILPWIVGLSILVAFIMYIVGLASYKKAQSKIGEVYIGKRGLHFNDTYYTWDIVGARLGKVELLKGNPAILQFEILYASKTGSRPAEVRVPVPRAHEHEAAELAAKFNV